MSTYIPNDAITLFPTIFTPQGDGNRQGFQMISNSHHVVNSRQYLPRKGTETVKLFLGNELRATAFPTIFTPQGDGNYAVIDPRYLTADIQDSRQYLPRKGTETLHR